MGSNQQIVCSKCQKAYAWSAEFAGKQVRCGCGQVISVPSAGQEDDLLDLAPAPAQPAPPPQLKRNTGNRDALQDVIRTRMGIVPGKTSETKERERLEAHRAEEEAKLQPNSIRDTIAPAAIIPIGILLLLVEATHYPKPLSLGAAIPQVFLRSVLAVGLVAAAMFLARALLDVTFVHDMKRSALRFVAIALGPCAIYGICSGSMGELGGAFVGVVISLVLYFVLFKILLQLDARDTAICVFMTWICVTAANYAAYRADSYLTWNPI